MARRAMHRARPRPARLRYLGVTLALATALAMVTLASVQNPGRSRRLQELVSRLELAPNLSLRRAGKYSPYRDQLGGGEGLGRLVVPLLRLAEGWTG